MFVGVTSVWFCNGWRVVVTSLFFLFLRYFHMLQSKAVFLYFFLFWIFQSPLSVESCGVCVVALPHPSRPLFSSRNSVAWTALTQLAEQKPLLVAATLLTHRVIREQRARKHWNRLLSSEENVDEEEKDNDTEEDSKPVVTTAMVASIGFYKRFISPLLPPACRFLPTCSQYGVQAIEQFGPSKGAILTAWRLLRCSPLGGKGYDPPRWPPVAYTYSSY